MKKSPARKIIVFVIFASLIAAFFAFDLGSYLSLESLQASRETFIGYYESNRALVIGAYIIIYILVTALSLPGAVVMTLAGGAVFGLVAGTIAVSFASSIGATLACAAARFVFGDTVQQRFGQRLEPINRGLQQEGALYLFTLRLVPIFPFFIINLLMGLTRMPLRTFYWVSQIGMLPGTVIFVNAGRELGQLTSLSGILSPSLLISFALIGVFPLAAKKLAALLRKGVKPTPDLSAEPPAKEHDHHGIKEDL